MAEWFDYKLHLLVEVKHEVALASHITDTKAGDKELLPDLVARAKNNLPPQRINTLASDPAADEGAVPEFLHDGSIQAIIQNRNFKLEEPEKVLGGRTPLNIVYDPAGTVFRYDKVSATPVRHRMAYVGHEPDRGTIKYRCPARHQGFDCPGNAVCNGERD